VGFLWCVCEWFLGGGWGGGGGASLPAPPDKHAKRASRPKGRISHGDWTMTKGRNAYN